MGRCRCCAPIPARSLLVGTVRPGFAGPMCANGLSRLTLDFSTGSPQEGFRNGRRATWSSRRSRDDLVHGCRVVARGPLKPVAEPLPGVIPCLKSRVSRDGPLRASGRRTPSVVEPRSPIARIGPANPGRPSPSPLACRASAIGRRPGGPSSTLPSSRQRPRGARSGIGPATARQVIELVEPRAPPAAAIAHQTSRSGSSGRSWITDRPGRSAAAEAPDEEPELAPAARCPAAAGTTSRNRDQSPRTMSPDARRGATTPGSIANREHDEGDPLVRDLLAERRHVPRVVYVARCSPRRRCATGRSPEDLPGEIGVRCAGAAAKILLKTKSVLASAKTACMADWYTSEGGGPGRVEEVGRSAACRCAATASQVGRQWGARHHRFVGWPSDHTASYCVHAHDLALTHARAYRDPYREQRISARDPHLPCRDQEDVIALKTTSSACGTNPKHAWIPLKLLKLFAIFC